ncbi:protease synthase and sporulation negative regulatory protein PAI 1 [Diaporthe helianthi]|uniref:Protease synthase and sporulation negative regulatory protein PAI 1 n=1 Tax=Diaporthe helianthi TaxID=158607 RepID=A0A2P5HPE7_DIAHE|nr:protease synthase and sporulation negative regulatory protein PAI 1 [Diaporthe helianthi]
MSRALAPLRSPAPFRRQPAVSSVARPLKPLLPAAFRPRTLTSSNEFHTAKPIIGYPPNSRAGRNSPITSSHLLAPRHLHNTFSNKKMGSVAAPPKHPAVFQIREAAASDSETLAALGALVFRDTFAHSCTGAQLQAFLDEAYTREAIARDIADPSKDVLVATADDSPSPTGGRPPLLGFAYLTRGSSEPCVEHLERPVELQRLYIALGAHGRGLGKALSLAADEMARQQGFKTIWLGVWEGNHKAQAFYRKMGYEHIGEHVFDVGGDLQTDEIWWKAL